MASWLTRCRTPTQRRLPTFGRQQFHEVGHLVRRLRLEQQAHPRRRTAHGRRAGDAPGVRRSRPRRCSGATEDGTDGTILARHYTVYETNRHLQFPYWDTIDQQAALLPIEVTAFDDGGA